MSQWITGITRGIECSAAKSRGLFWLASLYYKSVVKKEIALAGITERDHALCIGGGICPFTAILLHRATGAKVTVIDCCAACTQKARRVIERLGLGEHVRVLCRDGGGEGLSFSEYSVVHFALQVSPMESVFSRVEKQAELGTRLLVRRPKSSLSCLYCALPGCAAALCPRIVHRFRNIGSTLLYIKGGRLNEEKMAARDTAGAASSLRPVAA